MSEYYLALPYEQKEWSDICNFMVASIPVKAPTHLRDILKGVGRRTKRWRTIGDSRHSTYDESKLDLSITLLSGINYNVMYEFLSRTLNIIINLILDMPNIFPSPPRIATPYSNLNISLSRLQVFLLLGSSFLGLFPQGLQPIEVPGLDWSYMYLTNTPTQAAKLESIFRYFNTMGNLVTKNSLLLDEELYYIRRVENVVTSNDIQYNRNRLQKPTIVSGYMEQYHSGTKSLENIFSDKYIGEIIRGGECAQKEIKFFSFPELIAARILFCPLLDNEAILYEGAKQFSDYKGYKDSFRCTGSRYINYGSTDRAYVGLDANIYGVGIFKQKYNQYHETHLERELIKLIAGLCGKIQGEDSLRSYNRLEFITGAWGSGASGGDPEIKFVLQWIASCYCKRKMVYALSNVNLKITQYIGTIMMKQSTCGLLWKSILKLSRQGRLNYGNIGLMLS
ncbi:hypothetical protein ACR3K2_30980 [Cryptosporidium serpentis]